MAAWRPGFTTRRFCCKAVRSPKPIVAVVLAILAAACAPSLAHAASPVSPTDNQVIIDTHTPTLVVQLDTTMQADGQPTDYSDVAISVTGSDGHGGTTSVAFCNAADLGGGRVGCSDPGHPLTNGVYLWSFMYRTHTCFQLPPIGGYQAPPSCNFAFFPQNAGAIFRINVSAAPPPPPAPKPTPTPPVATDITAPTLTAYGATGLRGRALKLRFLVHDDSGKTEIALGIYRGAATISTHHYALQPLDGIYFTTWTPRQRGSYRFCVIALDGSGNRSPTRCSTLTIR
jgi:hypothetical protein